MAKILLLGGLLVIGACVQAGYQQPFLKYAFTYKEAVAANYSNLLEKAAGEVYKKYTHIENGFFLLRPTDGDDFDMDFFFEKQGNPKGKPGDLLYTEVPITVSHNRYGIADRICYSVYPGTELDMVIKNIISHAQFFALKQNRFREAKTEDCPDGRFHVTYHIASPSKPGEKKYIVLQKEKNTGLEQTLNLGKTIIDHFFCRLFFSRKDFLLNDFYVNELKHQKLGDRILAYVKTTLQISKRYYNNTGIIISQTGIHSCLEIYKTFSREERQRMISLNVLKNQDTAFIMQRLKTITGNDYAAQHALISQLRAALFLYPNFFDAVRNVLDTAGNQSLQYQVVLTAALGSGNTAAQKYLAAYLLTVSANYNNLRSMLAQLGTTAYVTDSSLFSVLTSLLYSKDTSISSVAGLAMSNLANQYKYADTGRYRLTNEVLYNHYRSLENNRTALLQYLKETGNTGDASRVDLLVNCLYGKDEELTNEALYACRFIVCGRLDTILTQMMLKNKEDTVLSENVFNVIRLRFPSLVIRKGIYTLFIDAREFEKRVISQYVNYLRAYADEIPSLEKELRQLKISDAALKKSILELQEKKIYPAMFN